MFMALTQTTIRFNISANGVVKEEVLGVPCTQCETTTKKIEAELGDIENRVYKADYYEPCPIDQPHILSQAE